MTQKLRRALREQKQFTEQHTPLLSGTLGLPLNGQKVVEVANRNGYVYVRLRNSPSEIIQAHNNKVAPSYNLPVLLERRPNSNHYEVVGVDTARYENNWTSFAPFLPRHGNTHSFDLESGGGGDIVWVYPRQFMPLLVLPSGTLGAPNVVISAYTLKNDDGTWRYVGNTGTPNITNYKPSSPTGAVIGLVYLNTDDGNPYLLINSGTVLSESLTGSSQIVPYIPTLPSPTSQIPLAAIRLVTGTSQIVWDNIYDVRQFIHNTPTGTGGGSSINTGTLDARYLKLTADNDPLTGKLSIIPSANDTDGLFTRTMGDAYTADIEQFATGTQTVTVPALYVYRGPQGSSTPTFNSYFIELDQDRGGGTISNGLIKFTSDNVIRLFVNPSAQGTGTVVMFDGDFALSSNGLLLLLKNNGSPVFYVNASGTAYSNGEQLIKEAPNDGNIYGRKNGGWVVIG